MIYCGFGKRSLAVAGLFVSASLAPLPALARPGPRNENGSGAQDILSKTSGAFNTIAQKAMPAVVSIDVIKRFNPQEAEAHPFPFGLPMDPESQRAAGMGSGIIIRSDGYILTNHHVVEDAERVTVTLDEKHKLTARVVGDDPKTDLAVIRLESDRKDFPVLDFGDSNQIKVGDWAVAIGSPFGLNRSVSSGIISAKGRAQMGILDIEDFIQTDAAINPGSSGGPLLNIEGELIGINTAIFSQGGGFMGIGFAIPAEIAKEVSDELIRHGRVRRGWIGLAAQDLDDELAKYFHSDQKAGALISDVTPNSPASRASMKPGDIVLRYNNQRVENSSQFKSLVGSTQAGTRIPIEIQRSGKKQKLDVKILEDPRSKAVTAQQAGQAAPKRVDFGITVEEIPTEIAELLEVKPGNGVLVIGVEPGSPAFEAGLSTGDIILKTGKTEIKSAKQFNKIAKDLIAKSEIAVLYIQRGPEERVFIPLKNVA